MGGRIAGTVSSNCQTPDQRREADQEEQKDCAKRRTNRLLKSAEAAF
jgi:hypothetical protein